MKHNRLTPTQVQNLRKDIMAGKAPDDLKDKYNVAISTVNAHKSKLKDEEKKGGPKVPNIRGKRPVGSRSVSGAGSYDHEDQPQRQQPRSESKPAKPSAQPKQEGIRLIINNIEVILPANAKSVQVSDDRTVKVEI